MSSDLLDQSYTQRIVDYKQKLHKEAGCFGISMYGDGATVMKMPFINVMASSVYERSAVLDIVDTLQHMSNGGFKDASYIASFFTPHIEEIDPHQCSVDTVFSMEQRMFKKLGGYSRRSIPGSQYFMEQNMSFLYSSPI